MSVSINSSLSGLNAATISQNVTAHNIANINTDPYTPKQALQTDVFPVGTKISNVRENENSSNDLAKELTDLKTNKTLYSLNAKALKMQDRMIGEVIDLVG